MDRALVKTPTGMPHRYAQLEVVLAAIAFAASVPAGKLLLPKVDPLALSGVLYLSAGAFCGLLVLLSRRSADSGASTALHGPDWLWLGGAVLSGAVAAPFLLFLGLGLVSGHVAGLLLNFEGLFTVAFGVLLSGEILGGRGWLGAAAVLAGAVLLSLPGSQAGPVSAHGAGIASVIGACALWGLDNNLTQRVSLRDARQIVAVKGLAGGAMSLLLAAGFRGFGSWSALRLIAAVAVGSISFGLSIALFVRGLRRLGVLQTGILFALAPGFAAILCWGLLRERVAGLDLLALAGMTAGALLLVVDQHEHRHAHPSIEHAHEHTHDDHHRHAHTLGDPSRESAHTHVHRHEPLAHRHGHVHDAHHRHRHARKGDRPEADRGE